MKIEKPLKAVETSVSVSRSQEQIRDLLARFGSTKVSFEDDLQHGTQILRFEYPVKNPNTEEVAYAPVNFIIEIKGIYDYLKKRKRYTKDDILMKQAKKIAWRHIFDWVKTNVNLVEFGMIRFENIFLSYFSRVLPNGSYESLGEKIIPQLYSGDLFRKLLQEKNE